MEDLGKGLRQACAAFRAQQEHTEIQRFSRLFSPQFRIFRRRLLSRHSFRGQFRFFQTLRDFVAERSRQHTH